MLRNCGAVSRWWLSRSASSFAIASSSFAASGMAPSFETCAGCAASARFGQKRLRFQQVRGVEPFTEPAVGARQRGAGVGASALPATEAVQARRGAQFPRERRLSARDVDRAQVLSLRAGGVPAVEQE